jgi:hypothetical protein
MRYAAEAGKKGAFHQHEDGFACVGSRATPHADLFGVSGAAFQPPKAARKPERQDRCVILEE